jgi:hypothetical protein
MNPTEDQQRPVLSIDLGASYTKVAWRPRWPFDQTKTDVENRFVLPSRPIPIYGTINRPLTFHIPSVAYRSGKGESWLFGAEAALTEPDKQGKLFKNWKATLFDPNASVEQIEEAVKVARLFLGWLRQELEKAEASCELSEAKTRFCIPAFDDFKTGAVRLRRAAEAAGWPAHEMLVTSEPEANVIGLASVGKNHVNIRPGHPPPANLTGIYNPNSPLVRAAQNTTNGGTPFRLVVIDIGAFTTDFAICAISDKVTLREQVSFKFGVAALDHKLSSMIGEKGIDTSLWALRDFETVKRDVYCGKAHYLTQQRSVELADNCMTDDLHSFADHVLILGKAHLKKQGWFVLTGGGANIETISTRIREVLVERGFRDIRQSMPDQNEWLGSALDLTPIPKNKRNPTLIASRMRESLALQGCRNAEELFPFQNLLPVQNHWLTEILGESIVADILEGRGLDIGAVSLKIREALIERGFTDAGKWFSDHDQRLATAIGGASVILDFDESNSARKRPPPPPSPENGRECSCRGNPSCMRCFGKGWLDEPPVVTRRPRRPEPRPTVPGTRPEPRPFRPPSANPPVVNPVRRSPIAPRPPPAVPFKGTIEPSAIIKCWQGNENNALQQFGLEGWMGDLVFGPHHKTQDSRREVLCSPLSAAGKEAWLRLLCLGTCMGGRHTTSRIENFWISKLSVIWKALIPEDLSQPKDEAYKQKLEEVFDRKATGEDAELWRRVFYDFRKLHHFVYTNELHGVFLDLNKLPGLSPDSLLHFLKSGYLPDGRWAGVIGQSMTAPILFLLRELRRLNVIDGRFDKSCFYMNTPARRMARRMNWVSEQDSSRFDVESLAKMSSSCHAEMKAKFPEELHRFFDIPLQWYVNQNS